MHANVFVDILLCGKDMVCHSPVSTQSTPLVVEVVLLCCLPNLSSSGNRNLVAMFALYSAQSLSTVLLPKKKLQAKQLAC